jgi:hypothetical protein
MADSELKENIETDVKGGEDLGFEGWTRVNSDFIK